MPSWGFYGRSEEIADLERILKRGQFFFCTISGRRRIGKTSLVREALKRLGKDQLPAFYVQIPDSDERGVTQAFEDALKDTVSAYMSQVNLEKIRNDTKDFSHVVSLLRSLWNHGHVTALDEFQYFHRKELSKFTSHLQFAVDDVLFPGGSKITRGGLITLGSIHTEMTAILEDRNAPLFGRMTDRISVQHWDFATLCEMFREHGINDPCHRLFLWSIFEGVPKFYRDCFDQSVLVSGDSFPDYRQETLRRLFFSGTSPLADEAANWFLRELRGRYDSVLGLIARKKSVAHNQLMEEYARKGGKKKQLGGYLKTLIDRYQMVERQLPIFSSRNSRKARYVITDNFLDAWLSGIARHVQSARIHSLDSALSGASKVLETYEGRALEKLVHQVTEECSRKGTGDFALTGLVQGYWNKADGSDIEIDMVAIDKGSRVIRFGSCKRNPARHDAKSLNTFKQHCARFLKVKEGRPFADWRHDYTLYAPLFPKDQRASLEGKGYTCIDMRDFEKWLS